MRTGFRDEESAQELRGKPRFACSVTSTELFAGDEETPVEAQVLEVSENGLRARVASMIPEGCNVRLSLQGHALSAKVRFCRPDESGSFLAGFEILEFGKA